MKKYSVHVSFNNGTDMQFETDTNVKSVEPQYINVENLSSPRTNM
ncbi:hypothetical protein [Paenisporosarcina sp.]